MEEEKFLQEDRTDLTQTEQKSVMAGDVKDQPTADLSDEVVAGSREGAETGTPVCQTGHDDKATVETLIAEAERRGYLRGKNEQIEKMMSAPGIYEQIGPSAGEIGRAHV